MKPSTAYTLTRLRLSTKICLKAEVDTSVCNSNVTEL
jgi:hypothetical protein